MNIDSEVLISVPRKKERKGQRSERSHTTRSRDFGVKFSTHVYWTVYWAFGRLVPKERKDPIVCFLTTENNKHYENEYYYYYTSVINV